MEVKLPVFIPGFTCIKSRILAPTNGSCCVRSCVSTSPIDAEDSVSAASAAEMTSTEVVTPATSNLKSCLTCARPILRSLNVDVLNPDSDSDKEDVPVVK